jgi:glyoxylase-like metal-dependent hydrolase (beta-lactamase superfamily II)
MPEDSFDLPNPTSTVGATYAAPSAQVPLEVGTKIDNFFKRNLTEPYMLQRLTDRTYFYAGGFYTSAFYVGDESVLVLDGPENQGQHLLAAIASVTDLPISTIVYSHNHADHIISAKDIIDQVGADKIRVIASERTAKKMDLFNRSLPRPTETVGWPNGSFAFEDLTVEFHGFEHGAHADDAGVYLLKEQEVAYLPDLVNGDAPPFYRFGASETYAYYRMNVNQLGDLDWTHAVTGHGNVASKQDIAFVNEFLDDFDAAVGGAMASVKFAEGGIDFSKVNNHAALMAGWLNEVSQATTSQLRPKYGDMYAFETATPANAEMAVLSFVSYR